MRKLLALFILPALCLFADESNHCYVLPGAEPPIACPKGFYFTGEVIYWSARSDGLGFSTSRWPNLFDTQMQKGSVTHPDFGFDPGFKAGLGFDMRHDGWDIFTEYTWLHTQTYEGKIEQNILRSHRGPNWLMADSAGTLTQPSDRTTSAQGEWNLHFNAIDLEIGRNFYVGRFLNVRPFIGLKGTWQTQNYRVQYDIYPGIALDSHLNMRQKQDFWGIGMRPGIQTQWRLNSLFSLIGRFAYSNLWGHFDVERHDKAQSLSTSAPNVTVLHEEESSFSVIPVFEYFLGIRWAKFFCVNRYFYQIDIGWEEQIWMGHNHFINIYENGPHGDLGIQGLRFRVRLDF